MKLTKQQKQRIFDCLLDLEFYYANHGNSEDYENFETLLELIRFHKVQTPNYVNRTTLSNYNGKHTKSNF
ncbi:hypothetical protein [Aestuariivivens insulae]|uniref:hypothetical protein n=1 Tax=Aestuariivivens insulae TaxID=1621988 RepID=UPI001F5A615C|nr:hypothetical protein [Aestuariivivens insulae]